MIGNLYFVREGEAGPIKIGWTSGLMANRLHGLQVGNSEQLTLIGSVRAGAYDERAWHVRFEHHRKRSEWFWPAPELMAAISAALAPDGVSTPPVDVWDGVPADGETVRAWLATRGVAEEAFAEQLGYTPAYMRLVLSGRRMSAPMAWRIELATGGEIRSAALQAVSPAKEAS